MGASCHQWDDLNLETVELRTNKRAGTSGPLVVICEPKTKAAVHNLILSPPALKVMRKYKSEADSRWVFPSPRKEDSPMRPSSIHLRLHRILDHAGCNRVRFHDLWHPYIKHTTKNIILKSRKSKLLIMI